MLTSIELLRKLKRQHDKRTVSVLVGAGFSKNAIKDYPGWDELLRDLVLDVYGQQIKERYRHYKSGIGPYFYTEEAFTEKEIANIIHDVGYLNLVSKYIDEKGYREAIDVYIEDHMPYVVEDGGVFSVINMPSILFNASNLDVHKEMLLCKWKHIYTTNYDNLLELTNDHYGMDYKKIIVDYRLAELSEHRGIIKVHGNLVGDSLSIDYEFDNDKSRRYVISAEDYATYAEKHQAFSYQMKTGLLTGVFCLIGFSGNDPNFLGWLEWMKDVLDRDMTDQNKETTKVFMLTIGQQKIEKSRQLFYQNHHIGIIDIQDADVIKEIGLDPNVPNTIGSIFTMLFRYLNDGTSVVVNQDGHVVTNTMSQYQRKWSNIDTDKATQEEVDDLRRLRKSVVMPATITIQHMAVDRLYRKKEWEKQDAELFAIACMDCGIWYLTLREEGKMKLLQDVPEWQWLKLMKGCLQNDIIPEIEYKELAIYLEVIRRQYMLDSDDIKDIIDNWNATGKSMLNKAAILAKIDAEESIRLVDEIINTTTIVEIKYYASVLGNVVTMKLPAKYSYNEFKAAGINGFFECKDSILRNIRNKREDVKPYGSSKQVFLLAKSETDIEEAFRFIELLFITGFPLQYRGYTLIDSRDWYDVFRRVFEYMPYPALYYSLQLTDKNVLRRIGQDYAYSEQLADFTSDVLNKLLRVVVEKKETINYDSCLWVAKELLCCVSEKEWIDAIFCIFDKYVVPNVPTLSSNTALSGFIKEAALNLQAPESKKAFLDLILSHYEEDTYFYSNLIYHIQLQDGVELNNKEKEKVGEFLLKQPLNKSYLLAAHLGYCGLLDKPMKEILIEKIKKNPEEVEKATFEELHSLTYITFNDEEALNIVKKSILNKNIWQCGINGNQAVPANYLALNKISRNLVWTEQEMRQIMDNLQKNLKLIAGWGGLGDSFMDTGLMGLLADMMEFVEHECIYKTGLKEYLPVLKQIKSVIAKSLDGKELLDKIFDKDEEVNNELQFLARSIDFYGVEKYRVYVDAVINRALLQCEASLTMMLAFVEFLVDKHFDELKDEGTIYRLKHMLKKYVEVDYQKLNLSISTAFRCLHHVAKTLRENHLDEGQITAYWLEDKFVNRYHW